MSFNKILNKYRDLSFLERGKGDYIKRLMQAHLQKNPKYAYQFKNTWMRNDLATHVCGGK